MRVTDYEMKRLVLYWQKQLRLQDWHIHAEFLPKDKLKDSSGRCNVSIRRKTAWLGFVNPGDMDDSYLDGDKTPEGFEQTIIHELLHIFTEDAYGNERPENVREEQLINVLAESLYKLKHGEAA